MFVHCDAPESPWWIVEADDKRRARIRYVPDVAARLLKQVANTSR
jgi:polyphosphate kinase 2 (PPK2 family)